MATRLDSRGRHSPGFFWLRAAARSSPQPAMDVPLAWTDAAGQPRALTLRLESHGPASDPDV